MSSRTDRLLESLWNHPLAEPVEEYELARGGKLHFFDSNMDIAIDCIAGSKMKIELNES
jgi:hypothetical protein